MTLATSRFADHGTKPWSRRWEHCTIRGIAPARLPGRAGLLMAGVMAAFAAFPVTQPAVAEGDRFELENVLDIMKNLKAKADAERLGRSQDAMPSPSQTGEEAAADQAAQSKGPEEASRESSWSSRNGAGKTQENRQAGATPQNPAPASAQPANPAEQQPVAVTPPMIDPLGRTVDPALARERDREAERIVEKIKRAREARDAWDDPSEVLDQLPARPPAKRSADGAGTTPGSAHNPVALPKPDTQKEAVARPDFAPLPPPATLNGPDGVEQRRVENRRGWDKRDPVEALAKNARRGHVTVLLVMEVGERGVRRWSKTADPMLCVHEYCFFSRGPDTAAKRTTRQQAFGPSIALGHRGLACRSSPACIFRDVDLGAGEARLQPVDLRFLRHDRRSAALVRADRTCGVVDGILTCSQPVYGEDWRAWIVPEEVATAAGPKALRQALASGLNARDQRRYSKRR